MLLWKVCLVFVRVAAQVHSFNCITFKCQKLMPLKKFVPTPVHYSFPGYSRLVCPLGTLEGNMTDGNKTTCRNVLLPADNNRVAYHPQAFPIYIKTFAVSH